MPSDSDFVAAASEDSAQVGKPWTMPVVEIHDVADLTMHGNTNSGDGAPGFSS